MATVQAGPGRIRNTAFMAGAEWPIALTQAAPVNWDGFWKLLGDLAETDTGVVSLDKSPGWVRVSNNNEDGKGAAFATAVAFSPVLNGTLVLEARVELAALTARNCFVGFTNVAADDIAEPATVSTTTITYVASSVIGFVFDSQATLNDRWLCVQSGGTATAKTVAADVDAANNIITAADTQILRIEIDPNGTARWYIDGKLVQTIVGAASTTVLLAAVVGAWGTTTTAADIDVNYITFECSMDYTV